MQLKDAIRKAPLLMDGAMGTMLGADGPSDLLTSSVPNRVMSVHQAYVQAGADCLTTNTFCSNPVMLPSANVQALIADSVALARQAAAGRFVLGSVGPITLPPQAPTVAYLRVKEAYALQIRALLAAKVDALLLETIVDLRSAAAAVEAFYSISHNEVPLMMSVSLRPDGCLYSGHSLDAFLEFATAAQPLSVGINCTPALGLSRVLQHLRDGFDGFVSCHPNAASSSKSSVSASQFTPAQLAEIVSTWLDDGLVDLIGGCCGTTPEHIALLRKQLDAHR